MHKAFLLFSAILFYVSSGFFFSEAMGAAGYSRLEASLHGNFENQFLINPSALQLLKGNAQLQAGIGTEKNTSYFHYRKPSVYQAISDNSYPFPYNFSLGIRLHPKWVVGFGFTQNSGDRIQWQTENWAGRFLVENYSFSSQDLYLGVGTQLHEKLFWGLGMLSSNALFDFSQRIPIHSTVGRLRSNGEVRAWGFHTGFIFKSTDFLQIGLSYNTQREYNFENMDVQFDLPPSYGNYFSPYSGFSTERFSPATMNLSVKLSPSNMSLFRLDLSYLMYKKDWNLGLMASEPVQGFLVTDYPMKSNNALGLSLESELSLFDTFRIAAGLFFQSSSVSEGYMHPALINHITKLGTYGGMSYSPILGLSIVLGFRYIRGLPSEGWYEVLNFDGTYKFNSYQPTVVLKYSF